MPPPPPEVVPLRDTDDVVRARQLARSASIDAGFGLVDQTRLVTAVSELARNTVLHGGGGEMRLDRPEQGGRRGLRLTFADEGPGIPDVPRALQDGWTSGSGLGLGLGGARRLVHEFELTTEVGAGTTVTVTQWR